MSALVEYGARLLSGGPRLAKLLWTELVLGGDLITAFLVFVGLSVWAVAFGASGYVTMRATIAPIERNR